MKANVKNIILFVAMLLVFVLVASFWSSATMQKETFTYGDLKALFDDNRVTSCVITSDGLVKIEALDETGKTVKYEYQLGYTDDRADIKRWAEANLQKEGDELVLKKYDLEPPQETPWILSALPYLVVIVLIIVMIVMMQRAASGMGGGKMNSFARAKTKGQEGQSTVKFSDVAGADEEKEELQEVVEFLRDPQHFTRLGARIPRGVLLVGPPGTGKTLLAKAVAGEANVPFYSISGSDFVEMYVGVGASRVRDLFDTARKNPASIIFIDEIDAVGRHRGAGLGGGHDEREQTLNQLLVEMDGFGTHQGIIVMAATNRPDVLDPALLRPGRFDRQVTIGYPDIRGREAILHVHAKGKPFEETVDFKRIAQMTVGFTGANLANLLNESALLAARRKKTLIGAQDIEDSYMKILLGPRKKSAARNEQENRLVAYHEAGHAIASYYAPKADPVKQITILPAGNTGGVTVMVPEEDHLTASRGEMLDDIVVSLGGRVAEEIVMDDISTGASNDIQQATRVATNMVTRYGMSDKLGTVLYGSEHSSDEVFLGRDFNNTKTYSEQTASTIDSEIRRIIEECYARCRAYISGHREKLELVAQYLLKNEIMDGDIFRAAMQQEDITVEQLEAMDAERRQKSEEENRRAAEQQKSNTATPTLSGNEREMMDGLGIEVADLPSGTPAEDDARTDAAPQDAPSDAPQEAYDPRNDPNSDDYWKI